MKFDFKAAENAAAKREEETREAFLQFLRDITEADRDQGNNLYITMIEAAHEVYERKREDMEREAAEAAEAAAAAVRARYERENAQIRNNTPYYKALREMAENITID